MRTCPNCRYELRAGQTSCPMCGEEARGAVGSGRGRRVAVLAGVVVLVALAVGASLVRKPAAVKAACEKGAVEDVPRQTYDEAPSEPLAPDREHTLVLETTCGRIEVALDVKRAPKTASSVAFLAREGFYDGLTFHRVEPEFVIQGGDPEGTGRGGPGYTVVEQPPRDLRYEPGVMAMAKRPDEPPGSSGSQFFIVSGPRAGRLPPEYALAGKVSEGMDVVAAIEREGRKQKVVITKAAIAGS